MDVLWFCIIFGVVLFGAVENLEIVSLSSFEWKLRNHDNSINIPAQIPGGIFTDLRKANILNESIYYRFNDVNYRWVSKDSWTYSVNFSVNDAIHSGKNVELIFNGLDGIADIFLNHKFLGKVMNTFVRYRFDVTEKLSSSNFLIINFESPIQSAKRLAKAASHPVPPSCVPSDYHGECHVNFLRRVQSSFGWDWGLAMPSVGIWKPVEMIVYDGNLIIQDISVSTYLLEDKWKVIVKVNCVGPLKSKVDIVGRINLTFLLKNDVNLSSSSDISLASDSLSRSVVSTQTIFIQKNLVELWWPNGYGSQNLYKLTASYTSGVHQNQKSVMVGFRTAKLIQEAVNSTNPNHGLTFYFLINGVPIFAKGSNYIPNNILLEETCNKKTIRHLLQSAKNSNMNILRIWGGGLYECDYFYEMSDQYGILIWQDMMFACSMYPVDNTFLTSVTEEVTQQIWRLQHHCSIILWAGNNENEAALSGDWYGTENQYSLFLTEYVHLYVEVVKKAVLAVDNTRTFMVSSPSNGVKSDAEGYVSRHPYDPLYGDVHFYDYYHDSWVIDKYPMTRFSSEYGYQSLPSLHTLKKVATKEDLISFNSKFFQHRQHLPFGQLFMVYLMFFHFAAPSLHDVENLIYVSQINQAWSTKSQTEWYRKWRGRFLPNGQGGTMGAMYWQLNDVWQAPSWSSIEFGGKWKMLHYFAKKFYEPVIITGDLDSSGNMTINVVNDELNDILDVEVLIYLFKWNSMKYVKKIRHVINIPKESSQEIMKTNVEELIESNPDCASGLALVGSKCFVKMVLKKEDIIIHDNLLFPRSFKKIQGLQNCSVNTHVQSCDSKVCEIYVRTDSICLFIWLDSGDIEGHFSDNGFTMTESSHKIYFYSKRAVTDDQLQKSLSVTWLDKKKIDSFTFSADISSIFTLVFQKGIDIFSI